MLKEEKKKKKRRSRRDILANYYIIRCGWLFKGQVAKWYLFARGLAEKWDRLLLIKIGIRCGFIWIKHTNKHHTFPPPAFAWVEPFIVVHMPCRSWVDNPPIYVTYTPLIKKHW